jgi:hypothetical protein
VTALITVGSRLPGRITADEPGARRPSDSSRPIQDAPLLVRGFRATRIGAIA